MKLALGLHDVHVRYRLVDRVSDQEYAQALHTLSSDERERAERFVFPRDRQAFVAAHSLLRQVLSDYEDVHAEAWAFSQNAYGKPLLSGRYSGLNLGFNLAHTHGLVACAVCRGTDVGIDVESLGHELRALDLATRYFSPGEVATLHACVESDRHVRFIELWTLKESYVKAIGQGLSHPLHTFGFAFDGPASLRLEPPEVTEYAEWQFALFAPSPRHRMAVAVRGAPADARQIAAWAEDGSRAFPLRTSMHRE